MSPSPHEWPEWLQALTWRLERRQRALDELPKRLRRRRHEDLTTAAQVLDATFTILENAGEFAELVERQSKGLGAIIRAAAGLDESGGGEHGMGEQVAGNRSAGSSALEPGGITPPPDHPN